MEPQWSPNGAPIVTNQRLRDRRWSLFRRERQESKQTEFCHAVVYENLSVFHSYQNRQQVVCKKSVCNNYSGELDVSSRNMGVILNHCYFSVIH